MTVANISFIPHIQVGLILLPVQNVEESWCLVVPEVEIGVVHGRSWTWRMATVSLKPFALQMHANFPTAHRFLWGFEQLPRILWSWAEGGTSVWVNLCSLPPACWPGASSVWSVCLHKKAKTTPGKNRSIIRNRSLKKAKMNIQCLHWQSNMEGKHTQKFSG